MPNGSRHWRQPWMFAAACSPCAFAPAIQALPVYNSIPPTTNWTFKFQIPVIPLCDSSGIHAARRHFDSLGTQRVTDRPTELQSPSLPIWPRIVACAWSNHAVQWHGGGQAMNPNRSNEHAWSHSCKLIETTQMNLVPRSKVIHFTLSSLKGNKPWAFKQANFDYNDELQTRMSTSCVGFSREVRKHWLDARASSVIVLSNDKLDYKSTCTRQELIC